MSQLKVNSIVDASGGSNAQLYGVASPPNSMGFRNRIINGDMRIDQRNAGASVTPAANDYVIDRWQYLGTQSSKATTQRSTTAPTGFINSLLATSSSAYSVAAGDYFGLRQKIEGFNCADLAWGTASAQTVTLSFWVRSSLTGTFGGSITNGTGARSYPFTYSISTANTFEYKTVTIAGDTSGTWATDNSASILVTFGLGAGSTFSGTAGSWSGNFYLSATGATSVVGTNGATFYITGVQLEAGTVASAFERRDYGRELIMCQRYYQRYNSTAYTGIFCGIMYSTVLFLGPYQFVIPMRASPSMSYSALGDWAVIVPGSGSAPLSLTFDSITPNSARVNASTGGMATGGAYIQAQNGSAWLAFAAEL